jgi:DNA polymerase I
MSSCGTNTVASMQHWICTKNRAIEAQLIGTLKDLRVKWYKQQAKDKKNPRKPWYSVAEQSIKVICNASYGVFGDEDFVLYCPPFPEYVTGIGRWIITQTIEKAQSLGLDIIYGDTDSIFIQNPDKEKLDELMSWAKLTFDIDFELDKNYRYVCLSDRKKNYLGVLESGDVDVKGLTGKKKHTPKIFKDAFEETKKLLSEIQKEEDVLPKKLAILKLVKTLYKKLRERKWDDINDLAFHVSLSKEMDEYEKTEPQHLKVAKYLKSKGYDVGQGSVIDYIKTNGKKVKPASMTNTEEVDVSKYIEFLRNTFIQILEPLDIDWDGDILGICQMDRFCKPE